MFNGGLAEVGIVDEHPESWPAMLTYPLLGPLRSGCEFAATSGGLQKGLALLDLSRARLAVPRSPARP